MSEPIYRPYSSESMGEPALGDPNGTKVFSRSELKSVIDEAVKREKQLTVEYIKDCYGKTKVGKQIVKDLTTPIVLKPMPKMPWEER